MVLDLFVANDIFMSIFLCIALPRAAIFCSAGYVDGDTTNK